MVGAEGLEFGVSGSSTRCLVLKVEFNDGVL